MTYPEVVTALRQHHAVPRLPQVVPVSVAEGVVIDAGIAASSVCEGCKTFGLTYQAWFLSDGTYYAAVQVCPRCQRAEYF